MDLGIKGKTAIVCASSKGLGFGCAEALAQAGVNLIICSRGEGDLLKANQSLLSLGVDVTPIICDITSEEGQQKVLEAGAGADILVTNSGGPPPGHWSEWKKEDILSAIDSNMLTPINLIQNLLPGMIKKEWGRVVNITSQSVKAPIQALGLSNTARSGLTGYVAGVSRQVAPSGVTINNLLPGSHDTDRIRSLNKSESLSRNIAYEEVEKAGKSLIPAGRYGTVDEFGAICAFLCSNHAGFIVGQNILVDGGNVNSTF